MPKKPGGPNASVFVKNLPYDAKELDLKDVFGKFGRLRDVYIPLDFHTKVSFFFTEVGEGVSTPNKGLSTPNWAEKFAPFSPIFPMISPPPSGLGKK